jgi:hypothetical protein
VPRKGINIENLAFPALRGFWPCAHSAQGFATFAV